MRLTETESAQLDQNARNDETMGFITDTAAYKARILDLLDERDRLSAALSAAEKRGEWRPIETAPKDGTDILLFGGRMIAVGYWTEECEMGGVDSPREPGWQIYKVDEDPYYSRDFNEATHWQPLPPPPAGTQDGK